MIDQLCTTAPSTTSETELFPIGEVASQTGVNPVTLRAWERRYGLIKPLRTAKGHRMYTLEHIDKIHKVLDWLERGVWQTQQNQWLLWIEQLAERQLDEAFKNTMALYPPETLCQHLLLPLLTKLQQQWTLTDTARVEQVFFMTWLRTQLGSRIAHNNRLHSSAPLLIVSLSEQIMEPELWLCAWLASYAQCPVRVLEWPIPAPDLALAMKRIKPSAVLLYGSQRLNLEYLHKLITGIECPILIAGQAVSINRDELADCTQLTCVTDPIQAYRSLLHLNLLQIH